MRSQRHIRRYRMPAFGLVGLLLLATAGPVLSRMTCLMSGRSVLALGDGKACCPEPEASDTPTLKGVCCAFSVVKAADVDLRQADAPVVQVPLLPLADLPSLGVTLPGPCPQGVVRVRPPPLTVHQRASQLQVFRL